ncbi:MAG: glycine cleavage system protein GcvH [Burkholderiales bacterium]
MASPSDLRYTESHEWVRDNGDGTVTVGITEHAQEALGELVYAELPQPGRTVSKGEAVAVVESTKAASDVYAPIDGEVIEANDTLGGAPQTVNEAPYAGGWLFRLKPANPAQIAALLDAAGYDAGPAA